MGVDKLNDRLINIESALGGDTPVPVDTADRLDWHLVEIERLIDYNENCK